MIKVIYQKIDSQISADEYGELVNLYTDWNRIKYNELITENGIQIFAIYENVDTEPNPNPEPEPEPEPNPEPNPEPEPEPEPNPKPNPEDFVVVDMYEYHQNNPDKRTYYPDDSDSNYLFIASEPLTRTLKLNMYHGGTGIIRFQDIEINIDSDEMALAINDMGISKDTGKSFTGRIEILGITIGGDKLRDALHIATGDADILIKDSVITDCGSAGSSSHPDVVQTPQGFKSMTIENMNATGIMYQGLFFGNDRAGGGDKNTPNGEITLKNVRLSGNSDRALIQFYHHESSLISLEDVRVNRGNDDEQIRFKMFDEDGSSRNLNLDQSGIFIDLNKIIGVSGGVFIG